jgi:hypothetical protein
MTGGTFVHGGIEVEIHLLLWSWILQNATTEHVKTAAALIQALGVFSVMAGAVLAYLFSRSLEEQKFKLKLKEIAHTNARNRRLEEKKFKLRPKEIIHANTEKRRLEVLEKISEFTGKLVYEMRYFPITLDDTKPSVKQEKDESRDSWLQRHYTDRYASFNAVRLDLYHAEQAYSIYLPDEMVDRLGRFQVSMDPIITDFINGMITESPNQKTHEDFIAGWEAAKRERKEIVQEIKKLMSA